MRRFFSLIFTIISFSFFVKSQNVYVSISSEMDSMILGKQSRKTDYCQYRLKISYENKTDSAIYFNKVVKVFLCIKCKELFELHSSARGERLYETGYWKQFSGSLKRKSTIKNKVKIRLILTKLKQFFKEIK